MIGLTESQFSQLLGSIQIRQEHKIPTFSGCTAKFIGKCNNVSKVEDFIATILAYKAAENISDFYALTSFPLLLDGYAASWWQGVKNEPKTFDGAIELLRNAFSPPRPDWRICAEIFQDKQKPTETTDEFVCRKRRLFAQLKNKIDEKLILNLIYHQISSHIRDKMGMENINCFQDLLLKARNIELSYHENNNNSFEKQLESTQKSSEKEEPHSRCML